MVADGVLDNPPVHAVYALHGTTALGLGGIGIREGAAMAASRYFTITIRGKGCHAASPHRGIDPVLIGAQIICGVQSIVSRNINPFDNCLITIPKFTGSTAPNVIPEQVELQGTLRALTNESRTLLEERLRLLVENTAAAHGGSASIEYYGGYPLLVNDPVETGYVLEVAREVLESENIDSEYPPSLGAEDFAFYLEKVPGALFWLGLEPEGVKAPPLHHPRFDFNDEAIPLALRLHCQLVLNFQSRQ